MVPLPKRIIRKRACRPLYCVSFQGTLTPETLIDITRFGTVATLLELVPVVSILFAFTNTGKTTKNQLSVWQVTDLAISWCRAVGSRYWEIASGRNEQDDSSGLKRRRQKGRVEDYCKGPRFVCQALKSWFDLKVLCLASATLCHFHECTQP